MDGKGFFLGLIAAVVLFLLWKKESGGNAPFSFSFSGLQPGDAGAGGGCAGCSGPGGCPGCAGSPSYAAGPGAQAMLADQTAGQISPGTPPLQSVIGSGSFYAASGPTSDASFTNFPAKPISTTPTNPIPVPFRPIAPIGNRGPSTPANVVPIRANAIVADYPNQGFVQRYNVAGVPRTVISTQTRTSSLLQLMQQRKVGVA